MTDASEPISEPVLLDTVEDGVAIVTMNRPDRLNALDSALMRALTDSLARHAVDPAVGCVVLTGAGRGFCAGGDIRKKAEQTSAAPTIKREPTTVEKRAEWLRRGMEASRLLAEMDKPTIAMINGPCAGAGVGLAGACDLRFAAESASFITAFVRNGASGDYGGSFFWTRILGTAKTRELYFLSEKLDAETALAMGVYNKVFDDAALTDQTMAFARRIAAGPAHAYRYAKQNLNAALSASLAEMLDQEALNMARSGEASRLLREVAKQAGE
ncbi:MAG: hypothetical protein JWR59_459 [Brevundimonas sp.]|nr:hypothetical protein [Brevundimonas sp.]